MNIFNSLGSNYDINFVLKSLVYSGKNKDRKELEKYLGEKYDGQVFLVYKGREAITLALKLSKLPKGSFVAINGFTCFAVYEAVKNAGLEVEYLDISVDDLNFSPEELNKKIASNRKIKAVIIQNTLGYPCKLPEISKICIKNNLILIEDLAHSVGTIYKGGNEAGKLGDFTILSFSQDKVIDAITGGALIVKNSKFENGPENIGAISNMGFPSIYPLLTFKIRKTYRFYIGKVLHCFFKKMNILSDPMRSLKKDEEHKLSDYFAGLALYQLKKLKLQLEHRKKISNIYKDNLPNDIQIKNTALNIMRSTNLRYPILVKKREDLIQLLKQKGIYVSDIWYDSPIAPKKYLKLTDYKNQCPNSEKIATEILNLPTHINLSENKALRICRIIKLWMKLA